MAGYKIDKLSLSEYFDLNRERITAIVNWQHKTDEIVYEVHSIARNVPLAAIRKAFIREKKSWQTVDEEAFAKNFEQE